MRYYFHFVSRGEVFEDKFGERLSSTEEAVAHAHEVARAYAKEGLGDLDQEILVTDEQGKEMTRIAIRRPDPGHDDAAAEP